MVPGVAAAAQLVREQRDLLLEVAAGAAWAKPLAWALRNPPPFGACAALPADAAAADGLGVSLGGGGGGGGGGAGGLGLGEGLPSANALELRRLVLGGVPDTLRVGAQRGAFRHCSPGWLAVPTPPESALPAAAAAGGGGSRAPAALGPPPGGADSQPPPAPTMERSTSDPPGPGGGAAARPPSVLSRLRCAVVKWHVVPDGGQSFAAYRIRVTLRRRPDPPCTSLGPS